MNPPVWPLGRNLHLPLTDRAGGPERGKLTKFLKLWSFGFESEMVKHLVLVKQLFDIKIKIIKRAAVNAILNT